MSGGNRDVAPFLPAKNVAAEIKDFLQVTQDRARHVIRERMPKKILFLNKILQVRRAQGTVHVNYVVGKE